MSNNKKLIKYKIETHLRELYRDLISITTYQQINRNMINALITKVNIMIEIVEYLPRLPLYDMEQEIIRMCKEDHSMQGINISLLFENKNPIIDYSKMGHLKINV
ncbi:hypothetical protein [Cellulophaga sp. L1A9]|uniref:hypothetical protein n=1 Tax=Cellulophaga sp. L1A9 TaxID=2686362 RepID=UPI00131E1B07|nr:hypothetical protein [Cellulophaga sp. L1A9]